VRIYDLNGDKLPDVIQNRVVYDKNGNPTFTKKTYMNRGSRPYFLKTIHTSEGARIDLEYKTSAQYFKDDGAQANPKLPIIVDTVSKITTDDGMGNLSSVSYLYEDGHYYFKDSYDKSFAGFRVVTKTDGLGYKTKTYYHQSENSVQDAANGEYADHISKKGRPYRVEIYDNQNNLVQDAISRWDFKELSPGRYYPFLSQSLTELLSGTVKSSAQSFEYDNYGNVIQSIDYGEVRADGNDGSFTDIGDDLIKTTQSYAENASDYLTGFPSESESYDWSGKPLSDQRIYYDDLPFGEISSGNATKRESWLDTGDSWISSETGYNAYGLPVRQTTPRGYAATTTYDTYYLYPNTVANAKGQVSLLSFDIGTGLILTETDPNNLTSENSYDGLGRLVKVQKTDPVTLQMATVQTINYDDTAMPRSVSSRLYNDDGIEADSRRYSDGFGRVIESKQEASGGNWAVSASIYDERGNVQKNLQAYFSASEDFETVDQNRIGNQFTYDALNRVLAVTNPLGATSNNYNGWETAVTDPDGNSKIYAYGARGNLIRVDENNDGGVYRTNYAYDALNRLTGITDSQGNARGFAYDSLGRRVSQTKINSQAGWSYEYDADGNLIKRSDPKGQTVGFTYDELDRPLSENPSSGSGLAYIYDDGRNAVGRLVSVTGGDYRHDFVYDLWGRVLSDSKKIRDKNFTFTYVYDLMGGVKEMKYPDGASVGYSYNNAHLLDSVESGGAVYASGFKYSPLGQVTEMRLGNGVVTANTYDPDQMYRLTDKTSLLHDSAKLQKYSYEYDPVGNLLTLTDKNNGLTAKTVVYEYDDLYRLTEARFEQTANYKNVVENYQYDKIGNIAFKSDIGLYSYNTENPHAVIKAGDQNFAYDENGNMTARNGDEMEYDYRNRMILDAGKASFEYGEGYERVTKTDLKSGEIKYYPDEYFEVSQNPSEIKEVRYIYAGKQKIAKVEKITEIQQGNPPADDTPADDTPVDEPPIDDTPVDEPPAENPPDSSETLTPYPKYTITTDTGREIAMQSGSYRSMEHLEQMSAIGRGEKLTLNEIELNRIKTENTENSQSGIPKNFRPQVKSDIRFANLRIEYGGSKAVITWDAMGKEAVRFRIYRSKQPYPGKLSKDATQFIGEMRAGAAVNKFTDEKTGHNEKYTYRVVALNKSGQILASSAQLNAKQIFLEKDSDNVVDFRGFFIGDFDKIRFAKNENLSFKSDNTPSKVMISPAAGFTGGTKISARFLKCEMKKDGAEYCANVGDETLDAYVISKSADSPRNLSAGIKRLFASLIPSAFADDTETTYYFLTDHLGSTDVVLDDQGNVVERADYLPFGSGRLRTAGTGSPETDYKFTGKELDDESGLYYYGARYYDSAIGRFVSEDNWEGDILYPQTLNKYAYTLNNPIKFIDSSGNKVELVGRQVSFSEKAMHTYLKITPDNPIDFGVKNQFSFTIGGQMSGDLNNRLIGEYNNLGDLDLTGQYKIYGIREVSSSDSNVSDTDFIRNILNVNTKGGNNMYGILSVIGYNCNNYSTTLLEGAGAGKVEKFNIKNVLENGLGESIPSMLKAYKQSAYIGLPKDFTSTVITQAKKNDKMIERSDEALHNYFSYARKELEKEKNK
jgi:RHS repeat-associated protein